MHFRGAIRTFGAALTVLCAGAASAQLNRYPTMEMASVMLLGSQNLQKELAMSPDQKKTVSDAFQVYVDRAQALVKAYTKDRKNKAKYNEPLRAAQRKLISTCLLALSAQQVRRLEEVGIQHYGIFSVTSPDVAKAIGMTSAQSAQAKKNYLTYWNTMDRVSKARAGQIRALPKPNKKDKKAVDAYNKKVQELARLSREVDNPRILKVQKEMEKRTEALLSKSQTAKLNALKGRPFKGL